MEKLGGLLMGVTRFMTRGAGFTRGCANVNCHSNSNLNGSCSVGRGDQGRNFVTRGMEVLVSNPVVTEAVLSIHEGRVIILRVFGGVDSGCVDSVSSETKFGLIVNQV